MKTKELELSMASANKYLDMCQRYGTTEDREFLKELIEDSYKNKNWLWEIFEKSPYYNGKGQLVIPTKYERPADEYHIHSYGDYIHGLADTYYVEYKTEDGLTVHDLYKKKEDVRYILNVFNYIGDHEVLIDGQEPEYWEERYNDAIFEYNKAIDDTYDYYGAYISYEERELQEKLYLLSDVIHNTVGSTLTDYRLEELQKQFPRAQARVGIKMSKFILKALRQCGIAERVLVDENNQFNKKYTDYCTAIKPMVCTKWSVLSINFTDYLTMSNGFKWTSCLNTNPFARGMYSSGFNMGRVLDYALDNCTMVFYTIDENYEGSDFELEPKITRQLFNFNGSRLIQGRLYPQDDIGRRDFYNQYRENVEFLLSQAMGEANLWSAPVRGVFGVDGYEEDVVELLYDDYDNADYIDILDIACHGGDERDFQSEVNHVYLRGNKNKTRGYGKLNIGNPHKFCMCCGSPMREYWHESILCADCTSEFSI